MKDAVKITLTRAEGWGPMPTAVLTGRRVWTAATMVLQAWGLDCEPNMMGVDKTDFTVEFEDGTEYSGTYGLTRECGGDLVGHIHEYMVYMQRPDVVRALGDDGTAANAALFLRTYRLGDTEIQR